MSARTMGAEAPPNMQPSPEVAAALTRQARLKYKRPWTGAHNLRRDEMRWLLKNRGLADEEIKTRLAVVDASPQGYGNPKWLGQHLNLTGAERDAFRVWHIRAVDRTIEQQRAIKRERKNERDRKRRADRKRKAPMKPDIGLQVFDALDRAEWKSVTEISDVLFAACETPRSQAARQRTVRRSIAKLKSLGVIDAETRAGRNGLPTLFARLPVVALQ